MQVIEVIGSIRRRLRQNKTSNWTDPQLHVYINDRFVDIADYTQALRKFVNMSGSSDGRYALPSNLLRIERVSSNGWDLLPMSLSQVAAGTLNTDTIGDGYYVQGQFIVVPSMLPIRVDYSGSPQMIQDNQSSIDLPETLKNCLVYGVVADCWLELGNVANSQIYEAKYMAELSARRSQELHVQFPTPSSTNIPLAY